MDMGSRIIDSTDSSQTPEEETEKSMIFEFVDFLSAKSDDLEQFSSVDSFQTVRTSMESYKTAFSSTFPYWNRIDQDSKRGSSYWISLLNETSQRTFQTQLTPHQDYVPVEDKSLNGDEEFCRICHCGSEDEELISPCNCSGSAKYAHQSCLLSWLVLKQDKMCELCLCKITLKKTGFKPLKQWVLPWKACDSIAHLFFFYCVVLIVFIAMVIWIASRRCLSPVCVVLYACGLALCYFSYCCGCIEHVRHFWKTWIESNHQWLILTANNSRRGQPPVVGLRSQGDCESLKAAQFV